MSLTVHPVPGFGAEDVVVVPDGPAAGAVYTGTEDGAIFRLSADGTRIDRIAETGGRPLGLELFADGALLVCDARRGLLRVNPEDGAIEPLLDAVDGQRMVFCNNAAIAADGTIWFSDSSTKYPIDRWKDDFVQNTRTGRLLRRDPDGSVTVVLDGLAFANGVALAADESYVAVAETGARTVVRYWLSGPDAGSRYLLATDLPGYPDNISTGSDGLVWVSLASPRDPLVERLQRAPLPLRRAVTKLPDAVQPAPKRTIRVQAFDDAGVLVHDLDLASPDFHMVTGVREHQGRVWLGSLHEPAIAVHDL
ncbi:SMP-30/gluconolactonase/LRE family protein [Nocardioides sp. Bht2]|uniref:SMP-30/gluconolactonase/LRE family protein n=1 Tax=Nocardioides sp. Bht2 TaxID=3392297 RepID=UPI0039B390CF